MKTLKLFFIFILTIQGYGQSDNADKLHSNSINSKASVEEVWKQLIDAAQWKKWDTHVIDVKLEEDLKKKMEGTLVTSNATIVPFRVIAFETEKTYTYKHKLSSGMLYVKRSVAKTDEGTAITEEVWYKGISKKTFTKLLGPSYDDTIKTKLEVFKTMLER